MIHTYRPARTSQRLHSVDKDIRGYWTHYWRFLTFCSFAGVGILVQALLMFALTRWAGVNSIAAAVSSSVFALLCFYAACRKWLLQ
jgi:putative flippase GtrA